MASNMTFKEFKDAITFTFSSGFGILFIVLLLTAI